MFGKRKTKFEAVEHGDYLIRELVPKDWKEYRQLYLHALKEEPEMFLESYADKKKLEDEHWKDELQDSLERSRSFSWGIMHKPSNQLIGILVLLGNSDAKLSHIAEIKSFYILPDHRKADLERDFLQSILKYLKQFSDLNKIRVTLVTTNREFFPLYNAFGFMRYGYEEKLMKIGRKYLDGILMAKTL